MKVVSKFKKVAVSLVVLFPLVASGSGLELIGYGSRPISLAGAYTAIAEEYPALYYNPAGMAFTKDRSLGVGYHYSQPVFKDVGGNFDIPLIRGVYAGFSTPLGEGRISKTVSVGLGIYTPTSYVIRVRSVSPERPNYIMYENRANRLSVLAGASFKALDVLAFGVGLEIVGGLTVDITLDLTDPVEPLVVDSPLPPVFAVLAGVQFRPFPFLSFGVCFRDDIDVPIDLPAQIFMFNEQIVKIKAKFQDFYRPRNLSIGVAYFYKTKDREILTASFETVWHQYSAYVPPVPQIKEVEPEALKDVLLRSINVPGNIDPGFKDIWEIKFGVEGWPLPYLGLRAGYAFRPTPVPDQTQASNYLDSNAHIVTFGTSAKFKDPIGLLEKPISVDVFFKADILSERTYHKEDPLRYGEDITFSGQLYTFGVDITYRF